MNITPMNITPMNITPMNITPVNMSAHAQVLMPFSSPLSVPTVRLLTDTQTSVLGLLEQMPSLERQCCVVHSFNPCPEYLDDLWQLGPCVLLTGPQPQATLDWALERADSGQRYRQVARCTSSLIPSERALLRYLPSGLSNKHIAKRLKLSDRTVRNRLVDIGEKLGLENRTQIAMYYAGQWQWLERYRNLLWNPSTEILNAAD
jgi:DNA-binding CsgD family transcriptional regulator